MSHSGPGLPPRHLPCSSHEAMLTQVRMEGAMIESQTAIYRGMTPAERLAAGCSLHDFAHERLVCQLRRSQPIQAARRFLGDAARLLPQGPEDAGDA